MGSQNRKTSMHFSHMAQVDVPQGRNGKHKPIVTQILSDLDQLQAGSALKVPLAMLTDTKENVRSALNRATRKSGRHVATASDGTFLYVWNETETP
jgi:DNA helicase TIP49 (TBP-interacting protein)